MNALGLFLIVFGVIAFVSTWLSIVIVQSNTNRSNKYDLERLRRDYKELVNKQEALLARLKLRQHQNKYLYTFEKVKK